MGKEAKDFNQLVQEKFKDPVFLREYYREAAFYRLADQLLLLRKQRGMTQGELAQRAGTTQAVVSRLENASVRPSLETIVKIAEALDAAVDVRLVRLEALEEENDRGGPSLEDELPNPADLVQFLHTRYDAKDEENLPGQSFTWEQPNCWMLLKKPTLHPAKATKKIPEYS